jgi:hypothetical protein
MQSDFLDFSHYFFFLFSLPVDLGLGGKKDVMGFDRS